MEPLTYVKGKDSNRTFLTIINQESGIISYMESSGDELPKPTEELITLDREKDKDAIEEYNFDLLGNSEGARFLPLVMHKFKVLDFNVETDTQILTGQLNLYFKLVSKHLEITPETTGVYAIGIPFNKLHNTAYVENCIASILNIEETSNVDWK